MNLVISALVGLLLGLIAHNLAAQSLHDADLRPFRWTCPECGTNRAPSRLVCQQCDRRPWRELVVAAASAGMAVAIYEVIGTSWALVPYAGFILLTMALGLTDIDAMRIVDRLNLRGTAMVVAALGATSLIDNRFSDFLRGLGGGAVYFGGSLLLLLLVRGKGFGAGDVKLAPLLGVFTTYLGWEILARSVFSTAIIGGLLALFAIAFMAAKRNTELPYGPAMILGSWVAIVMVGVGS